MRSRALAAAFVLLAPLSAAAQSQQGPMIIERIESGFVVAPDVKITEVDHTTGALVGANAGWVVDQTVFFGGGGYWLADNSHDREMAYGGFVFQWLGGSNDRFGWGLKGLIGGGSATLSDTVTYQVPVFAPIPVANGRPDFGHVPPPTFKTVTAQLLVRDGFFVAEPEASLRIRLARHARLTAGIGYRATAADFHHYGSSSNRLNGAVGSLGIQFGGGL